MNADRPPVMFVHGSWVAAASWQPWEEMFAGAGHETAAPAWPGEPETVAGAREHADRQAGFGITEIADHLGVVARKFGRAPVVVGHSVGGLIAQILLSRGVAAAAVAISPAPIRGVWRLPPAQLKALWPVVRSPGNRRRAVSLTREQWRYAFGSALAAGESDELYGRWAIPSPGRPLFQATLANLDPRAPSSVATRRGDRGPLLMVAATEDRLVPAAVTRAAHRLYHESRAVTDLVELPGRGHSLTMDHGWAEVAATTLEWIGQRAAEPS